MKLLVNKKHVSIYPNPIRFKKGAPLILGKKDSEYEGWIWVTTEGGAQGWAPVQYLRIESHKQAVAIHDYSAFELETREGEELKLHYELNGWAWVENKNGLCGWIPMNTVSPLL